jgi:hypothetical protein
VARIAGTLPSAGTIAVVGHLDEPGAADNGSGIATMTAMATGYLRGIRDGTLPRPRRSVTFVFGAELECSREWLKSAEDQVDLALVLDMTGEDQAKSGSIALVERTPDPGAIWSHPTLDVHTEWGRSDELRESDLTGTFLNDYMLATLRLRALATGWNVRSNPFEGGSDHESFLERGIPAVLLWHFTDRFYHTSLDRTDKVDPQEMQHVAVCALALLHHYGNAGPERANEVLDFVLQAARERLSAEGSNARRLLSAPRWPSTPTRRPPCRGASARSSRPGRAGIARPCSPSRTSIPIRPSAPRARRWSSASTRRCTSCGRSSRASSTPFERWRSGRSAAARRQGALAHGFALAVWAVGPGRRQGALAHGFAPSADGVMGNAEAAWRRGRCRVCARPPRRLAGPTAQIVTAPARGSLVSVEGRGLPLHERAAAAAAFQ